MTKLEMLEAMADNNWEHSLTDENSYDEVQEEYDMMLESLQDEEDDSDMYPNGRDYDAENFE